MQAKDLNSNPFRQFELWFKEARSSGEPEPEAMALATASLQGAPSVRMVLCKGISEEGFDFFTNFNSPKARDLETNPRAAIVFRWKRTRRQLRAEGLVKKLDEERADVYFKTRPRGSQIGAWASPQSEIIPDRAYLEDRVQSVIARYRDREIPRPSFWGGFRLLPDRMEFWQERAERLHDRFRYRRSDEGIWILEQLAP